MAELVDYFSEAIALALDLDERLSISPETVAPCPEVQKQLLQALQNAQRKAEKAGKQNADIEEASFAVVAWIDELIARYATWWVGATPLQKTLFHTNNAGNEFFGHLNQLTARQDEVREVYYLCLCLGFVGQYYYETGENSDLSHIRDNCERQIPRPPASVHLLAQEHITPQPYLSQDPKGLRVPGNWDQILFRSALALAILLPLGALLYFLLTRPTPAPLEPQVQTALKEFTCARLNFNVGPDGQIRVSGHVAQQTDLARLQQRVASIKDVNGVNLDKVTVLIWPFCEVVDLLDPHKHDNEQQKTGLRIAPSGHSNQYTQGEYLALSLTAPNQNVYVSVDYFTRDGYVVHMVPNGLDSSNSMSAGQKLTIGDPSLPNKRNWKIQPPLGQEMVTIVSSQHPLFNQPRPESEPAAAYLPAFKQAIANEASQGKLFADYSFIESR